MAVVKWLDKAWKQLRNVDSRYKNRILDKVEKLANYPNQNQNADIIELKGSKNKFRMRIGFYRVLFEVIDGVPKVIEIQEIKKRDEQTYRNH